MQRPRPVLSADVADASIMSVLITQAQRTSAVTASECASPAGHGHQGSVEPIRTNRPEPLWTACSQVVLHQDGAWWAV